MSHKIRDPECTISGKSFLWAGCGDTRSWACAVPEGLPNPLDGISGWNPWVLEALEVRASEALEVRATYAQPTRSEGSSSFWDHLFVRRLRGAPRHPIRAMREGLNKNTVEAR